MERGRPVHPSSNCNQWRYGELPTPAPLWHTNACIEATARGTFALRWPAAVSLQLRPAKRPTCFTKSASFSEEQGGLPGVRGPDGAPACVVQQAVCRKGRVRRADERSESSRNALFRAGCRRSSPTNLDPQFPRSLHYPRELSHCRVTAATRFGRGRQPPGLTP